MMADLQVYGTNGKLIETCLKTDTVPVFVRVVDVSEIRGFERENPPFCISKFHIHMPPDAPPMKPASNRTCHLQSFIGGLVSNVRYTGSV
jgi:hypothetical protein